MKIRLFRCKICGHRMRLGASKCGSCRSSTPLVNRPQLIIAGLAVVSAIISLMKLV